MTAVADSQTNRSRRAASVVAGLRKRAIWIPLLLLTLWTAIPLAWTVLASFKGPIEIYEGNALPASLDFRAYTAILTGTNFGRLFLNSALLAITSTLLSLIISSIAAYGFARWAFKWRHVLLLFILIPRLVPRVSLVVPLYRILLDWNLINTYTGLILTYTATAVPLCTWLLTGFFGAIPKDIDEAAEIDGATVLQRYWRVSLPLVMPGLITAGVLAFQQSWNEFPFAMAFTSSSDMRTLPFQLFLLRDSQGLQDWPLVNAFTVLTIIPVVLIFLVFERRIVSGLMQGAVK